MENGPHHLRGGLVQPPPLIRNLRSRRSCVGIDDDVIELIPIRRAGSRPKAPRRQGMRVWSLSLRGVGVSHFALMALAPLWSSIWAAGLHRLAIPAADFGRARQAAPTASRDRVVQ